MEQTPDQKKNRLFIILAGIFITNALLAEMIGVKIFSLEQTFGFNPAQLNILGFTMDFNLTAGVMIWPVVFITTDLINEYFGKPGVKQISYLAAGLIAYVFIVVFFTMRLSPAEFWHYTKDANGNVVDMDIAFNKIFGQGQRIIIGSLTAFIFSQLIDVFAFQKSNGLPEISISGFVPQAQHLYRNYSTALLYYSLHSTAPIKPI